MAWGQQEKEKAKTVNNMSTMNVERSLVLEKAKSAANMTRMNLERTVTLENDSKAEDVVISVEKETESFELVISSSVMAGKLSIEILDPSGNKQGNFSVDAQLATEKQERVTGNFHKSLKEPQSGNWKIKIMPTAAKGQIKIQTAMLQ
ncbi:hypothetical protein WSM22_31930 [Cytophagales bacterium WSM2-2]|nr:hypothetical protein WSM22_31930 [Cytophagales bacterium WSM2-2]